MEIGSEKWKNIIFDAAKVFNIHLDPEKAELFAVHARELISWNRKINLTAITDPLELAVKHWADSIAPARIIPPNVSVLDIGSGGGFPGIPLKILIPSLSVTLIDASRKKVTFLKHVIRTLKLVDVDARHLRAEEMVIDRRKTDTRQDTADDLKGQAAIRLKKDSIKLFDVIISRALSSLNEFIFMALPLLADSGMIVALRGKVSEAEIESARSHIAGPLIASKFDRQNFSLELIKYTLPFDEAQRSIVMISGYKKEGRSL
jgi:16S rRNA (guanine527-N7)-methyltransferase